MRKLGIAAPLALCALLAFARTAPAQEAAHPNWSWRGVFGHYDPAQLKRGFQVYHDVCSNCHSLTLVAYRNLAEIGLSDDDIAKVAAEKQVADGPNDQGDMFQRPGKPSDHFVPPFPNEQAARAANNGAAPPDLSLMVKAREGGPDYVYDILTGFGEAPKDVKMRAGMNYNKAFPGNQIAMPPPLADGTVTYADGTKATLDQEARDVVAFLNWAAEPELDVRHNLGVKVMIFAGILTLLAYALKRKIWADVH